MRNKAYFINKCNELGIPLDATKKYRNIDLVRLLGQYYFQLKPSKALEMRNELETLMLAARYTDLKKDKKEELFNDEKWIAEPKFNGCRCLIIYLPESGFHFYSRNLSEVTYLPVDFTEKILLIKDGVVTAPSAYAGKFSAPFILDSEVVASGNIDSGAIHKYGTQTVSEQNATAAILQMNKELCYEIQTTQASLNFFVFDCLYYEDWIMKKTFQNRKFIQENIVNKLNSLLPFTNATMYYTKKEKEDAWEHQLHSKGEGLIFKHLDKPYHPHESRQKDTIIKMKRSMSFVLADTYDLSDLDMYISGYELPSAESKFSDYIGAVRFSINLNKKDGTQVEHHLATVSGISVELKRSMSQINPESNLPELKAEYYNKVCSVDGMSVTKNLKFSHAKSNFEFRIDKSPYECVINEQFLLDNII